MIMPKERVLLDRLIEEALDQPNPTKGLRQATQDCSNYQLARALKARAKNAARVRRYKFKKAARQRKHRAKSIPYFESIKNIASTYFNGHKP